MRYLHTLATASVLLLAVGCQDRANLRDLPDRQGHAYRTGGAERPQSKVSQVFDDETTYTVVAGETLVVVAKKFTTTVEALVQRNDLQDHKLSAGQVLIVKKPAAPAK